MMAADWLSTGMVSARWFHAAPAGKNGRVQVLPDCVPESPARPEDPEEPEEPVEPEEAPEPDEVLEPEEAPESFPPEPEDAPPLDDPPEPEEPSAPELTPNPLDEPPFEASRGPPSGLLPLPPPHAMGVRMTAIAIFDWVRIPHKVAGRARPRLTSLIGVPHLVRTRVLMQRGCAELIRIVTLRRAAGRARSRTPNARSSGCMRRASTRWVRATRRPSR